MAKKIVLNDTYEKFYGDDDWSSREDNVAKGDVRMIDGSLHYAQHIIPGFVFEKGYVYWRPVKRK